MASPYGPAQGVPPPPRPLNEAQLEEKGTLFLSAFWIFGVR